MTIDFSDKGPKPKAGWVGPKMAIVGQFTNEARCIGALSFAISNTDC
jgi:hypothetical protein